VTIDGDDALLETAEWRPRRGARHLVPSFSLLGRDCCSFRFELCALIDGRWTPWVATTTIGSRDFVPDFPAGGALAVNVDTFTASAAVASTRLRVRVHPSSALSHAWMVTLSACDLTPEPTLEAVVMPRAEPGLPLPVPPRSQMEEAPAMRERICSPTAVAMVLEYWRRPVSVSALAAEIFHPRLDGYGVWPSAIAAAARRGVAGYLLRFPDWSAAAWCLARGMPIIASIRYEMGELQGAPIPRTDGHLVVLTGEDETHVFVNDPAGKTAGEVARCYVRDEFSRAWLARAGVGYVFFLP
jgi:hypothetical protein